MTMVNFTLPELTDDQKKELAFILENHPMGNIFEASNIGMPKSGSIWPPSLGGMHYEVIDDPNFSYIFTLDQINAFVQQYFQSINYTIPLGDPVSLNNFRFEGGTSVWLSDERNSMHLNLNLPGYLSYEGFCNNQLTKTAGVTIKPALRQDHDRLYVDFWVRMSVLNPDPPNLLMVWAFAKFLHRMMQSTDAAPFLTIDLTDFIGLDLHGKQVSRWAIRVVDSSKLLITMEVKGPPAESFITLGPKGDCEHGGKDWYVSNKHTECSITAYVLCHPLLPIDNVDATKPFELSPGEEQLVGCNMAKLGRVFGYEYSLSYAKYVHTRNCR